MVRALNGHLYTGISIDPQRRLLQHQQGKGARFFNRSPAVALVWCERLISQFNASLSIPASSCAAGDARAKLDSL